MGSDRPDAAVDGGDETTGTARERALEEIVTEFILRREEGESPTIEEYQARHPRFAEDLVLLLSDHAGAIVPATLPERDTTRPLARAGPADRRLGPYRLLEHVAQGGGGTVYRAVHERDGHVVALKVLDRFLCGDARDLERFRREAKMLRSMDVVSVVPVYDVGEDEDRLYIAMKWIDGTNLVTLKEQVKDPAHRLHPMNERARLVSRIARTFGAVHRYGILHRDVKPSNIMVDRLLEPALIDFGIAQSRDLGELTVSGDGVMGTPRYLAPEVLAGGNEAISERADLYGLGLCLYELCTGVQAFVQRERSDLYAQIQRTGPPEPRRIATAIPPALSAVILRAIEIQPKNRYPTMDAFADDLDRVIAGEAPEPATLRRAHPLRRFVLRHRRAVPLAAAVLLVLLLVAFVAASRVAKRRRIEALAESLAPVVFVLPEALPPDVSESLRLARTYCDASEGDARARLVAGWLFVAAGDPVSALEIVGAKDEASSEALDLLRAYLRLRADPAQAVPRTTGVVSTLDAPPSGEGATRGDRFVAELGSTIGMPPEVERRRRARTPLGEEVVLPVLAEHPGTAAETRALRALLLLDALPSDLDAEAAAPKLAAIEAEVTAARAGGDAVAFWPEVGLALARCRYGDPAAARAAIDDLVPRRPPTPLLGHLQALAHARAASGGDPALACRRFAEAAEAMSAAMNAVPELWDDPLALEPLRKLYASWAIAEVERGAPEAAEAVLARWQREAGTGFWADLAMPEVLRARMAEAAGRKDLVLEHLKGAWKVQPKLAFVLHELATLFEDEGQDRRADELREAARQSPMQRPESLEAWVTGNFFGLRPYSPKQGHFSRFEGVRERR